MNLKWCALLLLICFLSSPLSIYGEITLRSFNLDTEDNDIRELFISMMNKPCITQQESLLFFNIILFKQWDSNTNQLIQNKLLKKDETTNTHSTIMRKGLVAKILVRFLRLENTDIGFILFGTERYAYRICKDIGLFQEKRGTPQECLSGQAFLSIMQKVESITSPPTAY